MKNSKIKWTCSLSDGSTYYEGKGEFKKEEGELSPYQKLLKHIQKEDLKITSLGLYNENNRRWNLPSKGKNPKFQAFDKADKPKNYRFFRKVGVDILNGKAQDEEKYSVIEAEYDNYKLQVWVKNSKPHESWVLVV